MSIKDPIKTRELEASIRINSFNEVVLGYTEEEALKEASRCIQCPDPTCVSGCPVGIDIKKFIYQITQKNYKGAYLTIREKNNFPSICGRVCPAEYQCRKNCIFTKKDAPFASEKAINIHFLERFIGDYGMSEIRKQKTDVGKQMSENKEKNKKLTSNIHNMLSKYKVAVVGSGPAGICCAGELARSGVKVVVFESLHKLGGVLSYGIPSFRLPRDILDFEINSLKKLGVEFVPNFLVGRIKSLEEFFEEGFVSIFLGLGAGTPSFLGIPGENLCNIYSANEFLTRINLMSAYKFPDFHTPINVGKSVVVIGGGNTAIDAARVSLRMQKLSKFRPNTTILYRRTEVEMPARRLEIHHAKEEGVQFQFLVQPIEFLPDENDYVKKVRCLKCELGEPDSSGRRRPVTIKDSEFNVDSDLAINAIGLNANRILTSVTPDLKIDKYGDIIVNKETMQTSIDGVFAGGDIVGGEGTVIEAMGMAKKASEAIIDYIIRKDIL